MLERACRVLGSVGEPINPEAWEWYSLGCGRRDAAQSSIPGGKPRQAGIMITPLPGAHPLKPGYASFPFFGVEPVTAR